MVSKRRQEKQGCCGEQGDSRAEEGRHKGLTRYPWEGWPCQTAALTAVAEAAASLCVLSSDPGKGGTQVTAIFPYRCSAPVDLHLLSAALPGNGKELFTSAVPLLCWVGLNQKPAPQCVCKRCPNTHFLTPKWALQLLCCPCPSLQVCAELHCVHKDKHASLAKKIIKIY